MRSKSIVLVALAIGCGVVAAVGISQVMDARNVVSDVGEKVPIFVALADIEPNQELTAQNIKLEEWPKNLVPQGALTKLEEIEGKKCRVKLFAGETILASKLSGDAGGAANQIPSGYRVAHVKVDSVTGSSNLILPGDRVDVLVFRNPNTDLNVTASKIVLQDVKVFAVDTHTETDARAKGEQGEPMSAKTISLLVTPEQALILHTASEISGAVRLVLRNPDDDTHVNVPGKSIGDIFGAEQKGDRKAEHKSKETEDVTNWLTQQKTGGDTPAAPPVPDEGPRKKMIVLRGSELTEVVFPGDGGLPKNPIANKESPNPPSRLTGGLPVNVPEAPADEPDASLPND